jgi:RNA polymerase sigma factor (sigma-70 family)
VRPTEEPISTDFLDVVKRCGDGDPEAWRAFLPVFQEVGRRALRAFRLSPADADDIIADALASLYSGSLAHFRGGTTAELVGFLRTIVRNRAIDVLKHRNRWIPTASPGERAAPEPDALGVDDECVEFLRQAIAGLKREDRELYLMKARGLKEREIAEQTGRPPGTVASQIARLLERLRTSLRSRDCL